MSKSAILYDGPSEYTGNRIKAYITTKSNNKKTGDMHNISMLSMFDTPVKAAKAGQDKDVCGSCRLRPINGSGCYVCLFHGPRAIYAADQRGSVKAFTPFADPVQVQRHGTIGDPASLPKKVNITILKLANRTLSYTHAWKEPKNAYLAGFCMASVHSQEEAIQAQKLGFRTFRILNFACEKLMPGEILCLNTTHDKTCKECQLCCGNQAKNGRNVAIVIH